jgi:hypothetical protein
MNREGMEGIIVEKYRRRFMPKVEEKKKVYGRSRNDILYVL